MSTQTAITYASLISDCPLGIRTKNALINGGVMTVEDLTLYRLTDLLRFPHFGPKALTDVRSLLAALAPSVTRTEEMTIEHATEPAAAESTGAIAVAMSRSDAAVTR